MALNKIELKNKKKNGRKFKEMIFTFLFFHTQTNQSIKNTNIFLMSIL